MTLASPPTPLALALMLLLGCANKTVEEDVGTSRDAGTHVTEDVGTTNDADARTMLDAAGDGVTTDAPVDVQELDASDTDALPDSPDADVPCTTLGDPTVFRVHSAEGMETAYEFLEEMSGTRDSPTQIRICPDTYSRGIRMVDVRDIELDLRGVTIDGTATRTPFLPRDLRAQHVGLLIQKTSGAASPQVSGIVIRGGTFVGFAGTGVTVTSRASKIEDCEGEIRYPVGTRTVYEHFECPETTYIEPRADDDVSVALLGPAMRTNRTNLYMQARGFIVSDASITSARHHGIYVEHGSRDGLIESSVIASNGGVASAGEPEIDGLITGLSNGIVLDGAERIRLVRNEIRDNGKHGVTIYRNCGESGSVVPRILASVGHELVENTISGHRNLDGTSFEVGTSAGVSIGTRQGLSLSGQGLCSSYESYVAPEGVVLDGMTLGTSALLFNHRDMAAASLRDNTISNNAIGVYVAAAWDEVRVHGTRFEGTRNNDLDMYIGHPPVFEDDPGPAPLRGCVEVAGNQFQAATTRSPYVSNTGSAPTIWGDDATRFSPASWYETLCPDDSCPGTIVRCWEDQDCREGLTCNLANHRCR